MFPKETEKNEQLGKIGGRGGGIMEWENKIRKK